MPICNRCQEYKEFVDSMGVCVSCLKEARRIKNEYSTTLIERRDTQNVFQKKATANKFSDK